MRYALYDLPIHGDIWHMQKAIADQELGGFPRVSARLAVALTPDDRMLAVDLDKGLTYCLDRSLRLDLTESEPDTELRLLTVAEVAKIPKALAAQFIRYTKAISRYQADELRPMIDALNAAYNKKAGD